MGRALTVRQFPIRKCPCQGRPNIIDIIESVSTEGTFLKRYTNVMSLIDMLVNRHLVLTETSGWRDTNDHLVIEEYRRRVGATKAFAICLTGASETFHHWEIFAGGQTGVCVEFDRQALVAALPPTLLAGSITYKTFPEIRAHGPIDTAAIHFLKRHGFRDEKEFRIVGTSDDPDLSCIPVTITLDMIRAITFSPFIAEPLIKTTRTFLEGAIPECANIRIGRSMLTRNTEWIKRIRELPPA